MTPVAVGLAIAVAAFAASVWLTGRVWRYALHRQLMDVPNARSSHQVATPRGGGMAIVISTSTALLLASAAGSVSHRHGLALVAAGLLVATVGFVDDHGHLARRWRILAHIAAAAGVLWALGGVPPVTALGARIEPGWIGLALAMLYIVWLLNLTNFMDGIDGIAAVEGVTVSLGGVALYALTAPAGAPWVAPLALAAATLGFLVWNWPPAKIFMGDAGSGFLGLMLAALSLQAAWISAPLLWSWIILLGVFVVDATVTLIRRLIRGDRIYEAHRLHAYQHAAQRRGGHKPVTIATALINLFWLLPLSLLVAWDVLDGPTGVFVAYAPLVVLAAWLGAGNPAPPASPDSSPDNSHGPT